MMKRYIRLILYGLVTVVVLAAFVPFLIPIQPAKGVLPLDELVDPNSTYIDANGVKIYYRQSGINQPVFILLHGLGASTYSWLEVFDDFSGLGSVVAYDRPGFGYSERPEVEDWSTENPYSNEAQLEQLWAVMDTLGIQKAILVGHSAGGSIAIQAALQHPERVESLILLAPAVYSSYSLPLFVQRLLNIPQIDRLGPLFVRQVFKGADRMLENAWHDRSLITPEIRAEYFKPFQAEGWDMALWEMMKIRVNPGIKNRLKELDLSVLIVTGDDDRVVPIWQSQRLAKAIPNAQLVVVENCGHMPQEEKPEEFLTAVDAFLLD